MSTKGFHRRGSQPCFEVETKSSKVCNPNNVIIRRSRGLVPVTEV